MERWKERRIQNTCKEDKQNKSAGRKGNKPLGRFNQYSQTKNLVYLGVTAYRLYLKFYSYLPNNLKLN